MKFIKKLYKKVIKKIKKYFTLFIKKIKFIKIYMKII